MSKSYEANPFTKLIMLHLLLQFPTGYGNVVKKLKKGP
jgi:hypothetical protein